MRVARAAVLVLVLGAAGCSRGDVIPRPPESPRLAMGASPAPGAVLGHVQHVSVTVENVSSRAVFIERIEPVTNAAGQPAYLVGSVCGDLRATPGGYEWRSLEQRRSLASLCGGFLLPGQKVTALWDYRPLAPRETLRVSALVAAGDYDGTATSLAPFGVFVTTDGRVFVKFTPEAWAAASAVPRTVERVGPDAPPCPVVLATSPGTTPGEMPRFTQEFAVDWSDRDLPIPLERARQTAARLTAGPFALAWSDSLGWVAIAKNEAFRITSADQAVKGDPLPPVPAALFDDLDSGTGRILVRCGEGQEGVGPEPRMTGERLFERYPTKYGDGMYTRGEFAEIRAEDAAEFLAEVARRNGRLGVVFYYFDDHYYELTLPE